jgi:hypothetical protein
MRVLILVIIFEMIIYTQFTEAKTTQEVNRLLEKYLFLVPGNQRAKLYQIARHTKNRLNGTPVN